MYIDVFNGDADGICALHQPKPAKPVESELVTGVKCDINLLSRVSIGKGTDDAFNILSSGYEEDMSKSSVITPESEAMSSTVYIFSAEKWARRVRCIW